MVLAGDAAGVVAPSSGEGIYYAMVGGRVAATAAAATPGLGPGQGPATGAQAVHARAQDGLQGPAARCRTPITSPTSGASGSCRLCHDVDVQKLTFEAYMNKKLVKARPMAHLKIGIKNLAHLTRLVRRTRV